MVLSVYRLADVIRYCSLEGYGIGLSRTQSAMLRISAERGMGMLFSKKSKNREYSSYSEYSKYGQCDICGMQLLSDNISFCPGCGSRIHPRVPAERQEILSEEELGFSRRDTDYISPELLNPENLLLSELDTNGRKDEAKKSPRLKIILAFVPVFIAVLFLLFFVIKPEEHKSYEFISNKAIEVYTDARDNNTVIFDPQGKVLHRLNKSVFPYDIPDRTAAVLIAQSVGDLGAQIYFTDVDNLIEIRKNVLEYSISNNGDYLLYSTQSNTEGYGLYQYDVKRKKEILLGQSKDKQYQLLSLSPDGKSISYNMIQINNQNSTSEIIVEGFYIRDGGEQVSLGVGTVALVISDHANYVYYCDYEDGRMNYLYRLQDQKVIELMERFTDSIHSLYLNRDYSEVMLTLQDKTYLCLKNGEPFQATDAPIRTVLMPDKCNKTEDGFVKALTGINVDTFRNKVFLCTDNTLRVYVKGENARIIGEVYRTTDVTLSEDGNHLLYRSYDRVVRKINDLFGECREETYISDVDSYIASGDLSEVYYLKDAGLYYKKGASEPKHIADHVSELYWNTDYTQALFAAEKEGSNNTLYSCSQGNEPEELLAYSSNSIQRMYYGISIVGISSTGYEVYYNTEGNRMKRIYNTTDSNK